MVVIKIIKTQNEKQFRRDVERMRRWLKIFLMFSPKLRKVGNPIALLNHVADYTTRELDLRNEIAGAKELKEIQNQISNNFPMDLLRFPTYYPTISNEHVLVSEFIEGESLEEGIENGTLGWDTLLQLFRIHGAFLFGIGTFHGDLHPGNVMLSEDGKFTFIDTGAICYSPKRVSNSLFGFFFNLAKYQKKDAYDALLQMSDVPPTGKKLEEYYDEMTRLYDSFEGKSVSEVSLTQQMMGTVKTAVLAGCAFDETSFPIIRSLMYMDGLVLETYPDVDLITSMGPYLDEFLSLTNN